MAIRNMKKRMNLDGGVEATESPSSVSLVMPEEIPSAHDTMCLARVLSLRLELKKSSQIKRDCGLTVRKQRPHVQVIENEQTKK